MWRLRHWYARLAKGPDGWIVAAAAGCTGLLGIALVGGVWFPQFSYLLFVMALIMGLAQQSITMFLVGRTRAKVNDVHYALSLEHSLRRAGFEVSQLFYDGAAGTPSLQLYSLKILLICRPSHILELGSGQTTRILSAYARANSSARVITLEQDEAWVAQLSPEVMHERHECIHSALERRLHVCGGSGLRIETEWYSELPEHVLGRRYEYIVVDGPDDHLQGTQFSPYARAGILWHIPKLLAERFVVLFDDADLYKHQMAIGVFKTELRACNINFVSFRIHGTKDQEVVCSPHWGFLRSV